MIIIAVSCLNWLFDFIELLVVIDCGWVGLGFYCGVECS